jgi:hypothetical protein
MQQTTPLLRYSIFRTGSQGNKLPFGYVCFGRNVAFSWFALAYQKVLLASLQLVDSSTHGKAALRRSKSFPLIRVSQVLNRTTEPALQMHKLRDLETCRGWHGPIARLPWARTIRLQQPVRPDYQSEWREKLDRRKHDAGS